MWERKFDEKNKYSAAWTLGMKHKFSFYFGVRTPSDKDGVQIMKMNMFAGTKFNEIMMSDSALAGIAVTSGAFLSSYLMI